MPTTLPSNGVEGVLHALEDASRTPNVISMDFLNIFRKENSQREGGLDSKVPSVS